MNKERKTKRKPSPMGLTLFLLRERLRTSLPVLLGAIALVTLTVASQLDLSRERAHLAGKITGTNWKHGETLRTPVLVYVHLDDGRDVRVRGRWHSPPHIGDRIALSERVSLLGRVSYVASDGSAAAR